MEPGLYDKDKKLIYTWEELIKKEMIILSNDISLYDTEIKGKDYQLVISNDIKILEKNCFEITTLKNIYINDNLEIIDFFAFDNSLISEIKVSPKNKWFSSEDGVLYNKDKSVLIKYPNNKKGEEFTMPLTVKQIENSAFYQNKKLKKINIDNDINEIGGYAFACSKIEKIIFNKSINKISYCVFDQCTELKKLIFKGKIKEIEENLFHNCYKLKMIYPGTKENLEQIKNWEYIFEKNNITMEQVEFHKTLDDLIKEGYNVIEANVILKEQNERCAGS